MKGVGEYRVLYPEGSRLELLEDLDDPYTPKKAGDIFTVSMIDDAGNIALVNKNWTQILKFSTVFLISGQ